MEGFLTIKEVAEKWNVTPRRVQLMCSDGTIPGAMKFGGVWAVPEDAERPADGRVKSGKYRGWRKKSAKKNA
ncbi:MAG: helix-turn-helix domain-containing protein [Eubacterium sp.]|nr:helix-turn-helix domain-containing protein [Eubacterium sp.]